MSEEMGISPSAAIAPWLIERVDANRRWEIRQYLAYGWVNFAPGEDGFTWVKLAFSQTVWVALRLEAERVVYQCGCKFFKSAAPALCEHAVAAVCLLESHRDGVRQRVNPSDYYLAGSFPAKRLRSGPIAAVSDDTEPYLIQDARGQVIERPTVRRRAPVWKPYFEALRRTSHEADLRAAWPAQRQVVYAVDLAMTLQGRGVVVESMWREPKKAGGGWKAPSALNLTSEHLETLPAGDRDVAGILLGAASAGHQSYYYENEKSSRRRLTTYQASLVLPAICRSGRAFLRTAERATGGASYAPLAWDEAGPWDLTLDIGRDEQRGQYVVTASLRRANEVMGLDRPVMLTMGGYVFRNVEGKEDVVVGPYDDHGAFEWVPLLRERKAIRVPFDQREELLAELYKLKRLPPPRLPEELRVEEVAVPPRPRVTIRAPQKQASWSYQDERLVAEASFDYGGTIVRATDDGAGVLSQGNGRRRVVRRDPAAEAAHRQRLIDLGLRPDNVNDARLLRLTPKQLPPVVRALLAEQWHVEAEGKLYRQPGEIKVDVSSGIDWFDLNVTADFGGVSAPLPRLLAALRKGDPMVALDDGTFGVLPEEWLRKYAALAGVGEEQGESVRFSRQQAGLLDALLMAQPQATCDEAFTRVRREIHDFKGVEPLDPPATFVGNLRPYQRETLGWFAFLRRFAFGGCLADDMGLGKTVMVLALLESRRVENAGKPSLVVVPRSLIFNWKTEAERFAPGLRVLDQSETKRQKGTDHFGQYDLVLTTYGTLRHDAPFLKDVTFDYVVLDEAQAIKNADSESAKAARLLRGEHRLVLSGTPVQNHLGDLWSLFEFLNPGMLGKASAFASSLSTSRNADPESRELLARALRPFILRRTKEQVAKDLPPRVEQTLWCELEPKQRKLYDELRDHYRASLLGLIDKQGVNKSKIQILDALLRLRQAACHPGLVDKSHAAGPSAKLDTLVPRLQEILEEGHKALVFSQFTQFLTLVKAELKKANLTFEYLDGKTRDRQERVDRFQSDPDCKLFLISLKAGGVGLNLTAADYAFLLDPWWNPAVEAQAIDRTHRIGQTRQVFACRLIAKDTVEEKVLALQQTKRALADAILSADNSVIRSIGREDLELLLS